MKKYIIILFVFVSILSCNNYKNDENIVISLGGEVSTIDPHLNTANIGTVYIRHFFEGLMKKDKDGKIIPGIAERYEMSDDGLVYTFYLRTNAKWSDGKNFTADDFLYSYRRFVDPKTAAPYGHLMKPIKNALKITKGEIPVEELGIKKIDDYTLEITLENPTAYFLELADMYLPVRKDIIEEYGNTWVLNPESYICNGQDNDYKLADYVAKKEELEKELEVLNYQSERVHRILDYMKPWERKDLEKIFLGRKKYSDLAKELGFSETKVKGMFDLAILQAVKKYEDSI